jgi:hypothetical protein
MSLLDVIDSLFSDEEVTFTRRTGGAYVDGIWVPGTNVSIITIPAASIQPATGLQRVVGGRDMRSDEQGQLVYDVRVLYSYVELKVREPGVDPDIVLFEGDNWTVVRVEKWVLNDEITYRALIVREARGAS